jgi:hypothetical protein
MTAADPTTPQPPTEEKDPNRTLYWIVGGVVVVLAIVGLITYGGKKVDAEAQDKAQQLTQAFQEAGLRVPQDQDIFVRSFGTDGGAVCDNPADALGKAVLADTLVNGASFVGRRPVVVDRRILLGEALILQVYCPDKLEKYRDYIDDLKTDDVLKD